MKNMLRFSVVQKVTFRALSALLTMAAALLGVTVWVVNGDLERQAQERKESAMRVAWHVLSAAGFPFTLEGGPIYAGTTL